MEVFFKKGKIFLNKFLKSIECKLINFLSIQKKNIREKKNKFTTSYFYFSYQRNMHNYIIFYLFLLLLLINYIPIIESRESKIILTISGNGKDISIINNDFIIEPNKFYINDVETNFTKQIPFENGEHKVMLIWNTPLISCENMFKGCSNIINFNFDDFETSTVKNMSSMFYGCSFLTSLNLTNFKTSSVVDMSNMFSNCQRLESLNINNFDTSLVTNMKDMFNSCKALTSIDLSNFNVTLVESMNYMFYYCSSIRFLDLSNFVPLKLIYLDSTFSSMNSLISIDLSNFRTPNLQSMGSAFKSSKKLLSLDLSKFEFNQLINSFNAFNEMNGQLKYCLNTTSNSIPNAKYNEMKQQLISGIDSCEDDCFKKKAKKFIILDRRGTCLNECNSTYPYEDDKVCFKTCPEGTSPSKDNKYLCIKNIKCTKYYNHDMTECIDELLEGYYIIDENLKTVDKCNEKCKTCTTESMKNNICTSCNNDKGYCQISNDISKENYDCYNNITDNYYLKNNIYYSCYESCLKCTEEGEKSEHKCSECKEGYWISGTNCYKKCNYYYYFDSSIEYHCTEKKECPNGYKLISEKKKCIDNCNNDDKYIYEYEDKCFSSYISGCQDDSLFMNKMTNECIKECNGIDFFNKICTLRNNTINNKDFMIKIIENEIEKGSMKSLISTVLLRDKKDLILQEEDITYQITTLENQKKIEYENISSISLEANCEDLLKKIYEIDIEQSLIIFKVDYYISDALIPIISYKVFHPLNYSKLDLKYCENLISVNKYPVTVDKTLLYKYLPNNEYFLDECYPYTSEKGTDILIRDRQDEYINNNKFICENNCTFKEYLSISNKSICICNIKTDQINISESSKQKNLISYIFKNHDYSTSTFLTMKCFETLFSIKGLYKNIAFYILILILFFTILSAIIYDKTAYNSLIKMLNIAFSGKEKKADNNNNINIKEFNSNAFYKEKTNQNNADNKIRILTPKNRKITNLAHKEIIPKEDINSLSNYSNNQKSFTKLDLKTNNEVSNSKKFIVSLNNKIQKFNIYNDYELNSLSYKEAKENDKRTFLQYYCSLIRTKHPLFFSFRNIRDFNFIIIKIDILLISFCIYYFINGLFINKSTIHKLYKEDGFYDIAYFIPKIVCSFLISHVIAIIIKYYSLSERKISVIIHEMNSKNINEIVSIARKSLDTKYAFFFLLGIILEVIICYNLASFGAVYQNTQIILIANTIISIAFSFIFPFVINLLPVILRIYALKGVRRKCLYNFSKILQFV